MQPVPNHPYVEWEAGNDAYGRYFIRCHCKACGEVAEKLCNRPQLTPQRVFQFASMHAHGLVPRVQR